jgi:hypothetical protein
MSFVFYDFHPSVPQVPQSLCVQSYGFFGRLREEKDKKAENSPKIRRTRTKESHLCFGKKLVQQDFRRPYSAPAQ